MNPTIEPFHISDYEEVLALWKRSGGICIGSADSRASIGAYLERNPGMSYVARVGDGIVGAVLGGHDGRRGYIHHLAVADRWRRRGIAGQLVEECLVALKAAGMEKVHIFILTGNKSGLAFWKSVGWEHRTDIQVASKII